MSIEYNLKNFLKDQIFYVVTYFCAFLLLIFFCVVAKVNSQIIILFMGLIFGVGILMLVHGYLRKRNFYRQTSSTISQLKSIYLLSETLPSADFLDAKILQDILYQANKSMVEEVTKAQIASSNFREYVELWIHEVKDPLTTLTLVHENSNDENQEIALLLKQLESLTEQVLYFARAESSEQDYLIENIQVNDIVKRTLLNYRTLLQAKNIQIKNQIEPFQATTDAKWLEFILGQIISNSIKYGAKNISIKLFEQNNQAVLEISDDGIGIPAKDLPRVFERTFTGENGRLRNSKKSTGIGLYLVKNLCDKLGHMISVESEQDHGTTTKITFSGHKYYETVRKK